MTKEEFMKKVLGAQYSENEAQKGLLDLDALKRTAKNNLGGQFTEKEFNTMMGVETPIGVMDVNEVDQYNLRRLKERMGGQFTEKEAMNIMNKGGTVVDPNGGYGGSPYQDTGQQRMIPFKTNAYGEPVAPVDVNQLTQQFYSILGSMDNKREQERVIQIFQMSDDQGKINFMQQIVNNPNMATGYGIQDEGNMYTGENTPTKNFSNLGFN